MNDLRLPKVTLCLLLWSRWYFSSKSECLWIYSRYKPKSVCMGLSRIGLLLDLFSRYCQEELRKRCRQRRSSVGREFNYAFIEYIKIKVTPQSSIYSTLIKTSISRKANNAYLITTPSNMMQKPNVSLWIIINSVIISLLFSVAK